MLSDTDFGKKLADAPAVVSDAMTENIFSIHIISDSIGNTAATIAAAAATQFADLNSVVRRFPNVDSIEDIERHVDRLIEESEGKELVIFYTIANPLIVKQFQTYIADKNIAAVDLITPAISAIADASGRRPLGQSGLMRKTDKDYFARVDAMEFAVDHDDGRNPEQLKFADIVLVGASRTSKTPLSIYLAMQGYRVANVPLALGTAPPKQLFELEPARVFGLTSDAKLLSEIRLRRLGNALAVAQSYAEPFNVQTDLDQARAVMRKIGCIVVRTDNRAIEETAQEILRYYEAAYPTHKPPLKEYY